MAVTIESVPDDAERLERLLEDPKLAELHDFAEWARSPKAMLRARDAKIRDLYAEGYTVDDLMVVVDRSDARIYQILGPTRPRKTDTE